MPDVTNPPFGSASDPILSPIKQEDTFKDFDLWSDDKALSTEEPLESIKNYADYVREWYLNTGELTDEVDRSLNNAMLQKAQQLGVITTPELDPNFEANAISLVSANDINSDKKISIVRQAMGDITADDYTSRMEADPADPYITSLLNEAKALLVRSGEIPFATIISADGMERSVIGGMSSRGAHLGDAFKRSVMAGTVDYADAAQAIRLARSKNSDGLNVFE